MVQEVGKSWIGKSLQIKRWSRSVDKKEVKEEVYLNGRKEVLELEKREKRGGMRSGKSIYILNNAKLTHLQVDVMNNQAYNHLNNQVCN